MKITCVIGFAIHIFKMEYYFAYI